MSMELDNDTVASEAEMLSEVAMEDLQKITPQTLSEVHAFRDTFTRLIMPYRFAVEKITTKIALLKEEFTELHQSNPIEHISSRIKSSESIEKKLLRKKCQVNFSTIRKEITDIAGVRVVCSFTSDVYRVYEILAAQEDIQLFSAKDYIAHPKPNGYRSLHILIETPVYLTSGVVLVPVEIQLRTVAMDFWASLEHKIYYKYDGDVPQDITDELFVAAQTAKQLDETMESLHAQMQSHKEH